ncbi:MAG: hypothetical protein E7350_02435 [Clostridiales bacterium]|nr:hypothetical protein [Clostridiales bacterium]
MKMTYKRRILILKIVVIVFFALIALFPLEDTPSIETKTAVSVIAFDNSGGKKQIFVQMTIPQQLAQGSSKLLVVEEDGKTLAEAFEKLSVKIGQDIELAHCGIIIMGEQICKDGFVEELNYLLSSGMISPQISLFSCEGSAKDFMDKLNKHTQTNGAAIFDVAAFSEKSINVRTVSALAFLSESNLPSASTALPLIDFEMQQGSGSSGGGEDSGGSGGGSQGGSGSGGGSQGGSGGGEEAPELKELEISMMFKDGKAVGKMSELGTKGISMFDHKSNKGYFEADSVSVGNTIISHVPMQVRRKQGNLKAEFVDGEPVITADVKIKLEMESTFNMSQSHDGEIKDEAMEALRSRVEEIIIDQIKEAINQGLELGVDALGIENAFYKQCNSMYKIYGAQEDFVKKVQVDYKINIEIV